MANVEKLRQKYERVPIAMKQQKRWVCYQTYSRNGTSKKIPISANSVGETHKNASPTNPEDWSDFEKAIEFCAENGLDGIGFELYGGDIQAFDLNNTKFDDNEPMPQKEFQDMANDFVKTMDTYCEWSESKNGIHIYFVNEGEELVSKNPFVRYHCGAQFIAITGTYIRASTILKEQNNLQSLLDKYAYEGRKEEEIETNNFGARTDKEILQQASADKRSGQKFIRLMNGIDTDYPTRKEAIIALCKFLAYYTNGNAQQMDRLYRKSKMYTEEWDKPKDSGTHADYYIRMGIDGFVALQMERRRKKEVAEQEDVTSKNLMNLDEEGEPIFRISKNVSVGRKWYRLNDTGNAERFYDYFGENFRYDSVNGTFMFWTGKTWVVDINKIIRKYANELIEIMREEVKQMYEDARKEPDEDRKKTIISNAREFQKNVERISNKAGKDAMLSELLGVGKTSVDQSVFDKNPYLLNTNSGIVDLRTGEIMPFDKDKMLSRNTGIDVSYEEPTVFISFLRDIFKRENENETDEIIECFQRCGGYTLTGLVKEQIMFLLHGDGSNGKSTLVTVLQNVMGDYSSSIDSSLLMVQKNRNVSIQYSLAGLKNTRFLLSQETEKGAVLAEAQIKSITGADQIEAQKKFGQPFVYRPSFKLWLMTNNFPIIRGKDYGIWRRIFLFPFYRKFAEHEKDKDMPEKLKAEYSKILGWLIQGAVKYLKDNDLKKPKCLDVELEKIRGNFDTVAQFLMSETKPNEAYKTPRMDLFKAYKQWALDNNEYTESETKFRQEVIKKGFPIFVDSSTGLMYYKGIHLIKDDSASTGLLYHPKTSSLF